MKFSVIAVAVLASTGASLGQIPAPKKPMKPPAVPKHATSLPFEDARNMTLMIFLADPPPSPETPPAAKGGAVGSGVWIGKAGYVATCYHVVKDWHGPFKVGFARGAFVQEGGAVNLTLDASLNIWTAELVAQDADADVAILKASVTPEKARPSPRVTGSGVERNTIVRETQVSPKGASFRTEFPKPGEPLLLAGYPLGNKGNRTLILQTGPATGVDFPPIPGSVARGAKALRIFMSLVSNPGNSGGPVFDGDGRVIGLLEANLNSPIRDERGLELTYTRRKLDPNGQPLVDANDQPVFEEAPYMQNSGISLAVPARFIAQLAEKNKIDLN